MHIRANSLDDLLRRVFETLLKSRNRIAPTKGDARELVGVILELTQPRARLSRTETKGMLFSALGELVWYMAGSNELAFIQHYIPGYEKFSDDGKTIWGAYGPRLRDMRGHDQLMRVRDRLCEKYDTRKAVIQLFNAEDLAEDHKDVPCTCTLQFMIRRDHLHMVTNMRSNDAFLGLPHDVFVFTMLQEMLATDLSVGLGRYKHAVGSLHLYDKHLQAAQTYLSEGWQTATVMPPMPKGAPWLSVSTLVEMEKSIRNGRLVDIIDIDISDYWKDLARLLKIYELVKNRDNKNEGRLREVVRLKSQMASPIYNEYIRRKAGRLVTSPKQEQMSLLDI